MPKAHSIEMPAEKAKGAPARGKSSRLMKGGATLGTVSPLSFGGGGYGILKDSKYEEV